MKTNTFILVGKITELFDNSIELENEIEVHFDKELKSKVEESLRIGYLVGIMGRLKTENIAHAERVTIIKKREEE